MGWWLGVGRKPFVSLQRETTKFALGEKGVACNLTFLCPSDEENGEHLNLGTFVTYEMWMGG